MNRTIIFTALPRRSVRKACSSQKPSKRRLASGTRIESTLDRKERLRIWDRVNEALIERDLSSDVIPSSVLNLHWVVAPAEGRDITLRIADANQVLVPTRSEARRAAEARIQELEAQLKSTRH